MKKLDLTKPLKDYEDTAEQIRKKIDYKIDTIYRRRTEISFNEVQAIYEEIEIYRTILNELETTIDLLKDVEFWQNIRGDTNAD